MMTAPTIDSHTGRAAETQRAQARSGRPARPQDAVEVDARRAAQAQSAHAVAQSRSCSSSRSAPPGAPSSPIVEPSWFAWLIVVWLWLTVIFANLAEAVAEGRGKAQAEIAAQDQDRHHGPPPRRMDARRPGPRRRRRRAAAATGRRRRRRGRPDDSRRRRRRGRHCLGGRVGDHRRVGTGHPRVRRRPLGGHRRHHRAVGPHRRQDHAEARRELHRPDDRPRRGRQPAEDAERDRAEHPARRR